MPLQQIVIDEQSLDKLSLDLRDAADRVDFTAIQHVFSGHLVLASSGHIEKSVNHVLSEYGRAKGNLEIKRFVARNIAHRNALNCNKIREITDQFNVNWWPRIELSTSEKERSSVDSLKNLRDQIAHGGRNGTGFYTVSGYYNNSKKFVRAFSKVVLGY